jgi:hypothetical protein
MALKLINQYSIHGTVIAPAYNNQFDYLKRVPELINDGLLLLAMELGLPEAGLNLNGAPPAPVDMGGGWSYIDLPEDFMRLSNRGLIRVDEGGLKFIKDYSMVSSRRLALPSELLSGLTIVYVRPPQKIAVDSADSTVLDMPDSAAGSVPYYVASHLVIGDDSFLYAALLNEFETYLNRLKPHISSETGLTGDEYGLGAVYAVY